MRYHAVVGDSDYMAGRCPYWSEDRRLTRVDHDNARLSGSDTFTVRYIFNTPADEGVVTDCPHFFPESVLLLSGHAASVLRPLLDRAGETRTVNPHGELLYELFVCYEQLDALDPERTVYFPPEQFGRNEIKQYAFRPDVVADSDIFRVKGQIECLFVSDRFLQIVSRHRLTGFKFRPLWSSEAGSLATLDDPARVFERFPPGYGSTVREKRQAMRDIIAGRR